MDTEAILLGIARLSDRMKVLNDESLRRGHTVQHCAHNFGTSYRP